MNTKKWLSWKIGAVLSLATGATIWGGQTPGRDNEIPDDVLRTLQGRRDALMSVVVEERVSVTRQEFPGDEDAARMRLTSAIRGAYDDRVMQAERNGQSTRSEALRTKRDERLASIDRSLLVSRLNRTLDFDRKRFVDFASKRVRNDDVDVRNLDVLAETYSLTPGELRALSSTVSHIYDGDRMTRLDHDIKLAVEVPGKTNIDLQLAELGLVPTWVNDPRYSISTTMNSRDGLMEIHGSLEGTDEKAFSITLAPDLDYAVTELVTFSGSGSVSMRLSLSDHRLIGGWQIPFHRTKVQNREGVEPYVVEEATVMSVSVNSDVDPEQFSIPSDYRVQRAR